MSSSKSIVSSIAAAAAVTVIGLAYAQTSTYSSYSSRAAQPGSKRGAQPGSE